ncbi:Alpha/Beta hydrolase protein [Chytridium lagenaria]|nr:Alpha/Beta hydrolase protein [Chytridium lagenaria]
MSSDVPASCCTLAPVKQDYTPTGEVAKIGDMNVYLTGSKGSKHAIVFHYDIFGDHPNTRRGYPFYPRFPRCRPDLCRGDPWPTTVWPPESIEVVFKHILGVAPFEKVSADLTATVELLKAEGSERFGLVGFCWGGRNAGELISTPLFQAAAIVHPGYFEPELLEKANGPMAIFPAQGDKDFSPHVELLKKKPFGNLVVHKRFDDVHHGFCASRSDFSDELIGKRANECIRDMHNFFTASLKL